MGSRKKALSSESGTGTVGKQDQGKGHPYPMLSVRESFAGVKMHATACSGSAGSTYLVRKWDMYVPTCGSECAVARPQVGRTEAGLLTRRHFRIVLLVLVCIGVILCASWALELNDIDVGAYIHGFLPTQR